MDRKQRYILWFKETGIKDIPLVGGKNASLGEMFQHLIKKGVAIPNGFSVTAHAYQYFLRETGLRSKIKVILSGLNTGSIKNLQERGHRVRQEILKAKFPKDLEDEIVAAYRELCTVYETHDVDVAVRSSATAEDLPDASFAGQQESYLNIRGDYALLDACKKCVASLFTDRAISYRTDKGFNHFDVALSMSVQKMVRSDRAASGVMFSIDTESGFRDVVLINASYGLGEYIVKGEVNPDEYYVFKPLLKGSYKPIIGKTLGSKERKLIYAEGGNKPTKDRTVSEHDRRRFAITDEEAMQLARWAVLIERHYKKPMDMEWAKDGVSGKLFIVQARPETVVSRRDVTVLEEYKLGQRGKVLAEGAAVGAKIGSGSANIIEHISEIGKFKQGEVLVTEMTDPDWEPIMKKAAAIVTNEGGRTCHAAIVSRELGIPCIVGTGTGTHAVKRGEKVTVSCAEGATGFVYRGQLKFSVKKTDLKDFKLPKKVKIMMNVGDPSSAFADSFIPNEGVGLAREELIINNSIKIHPLALVHFTTLKDHHAKRQIDELTAGYADKEEYYIDKLSQGMARIAAAFYPKDVIMRLADFRSNEYSELIGGRQFEPVTERNPMIGWRGASRYYAKEYLPAFLMELKAIKRVRDTMGLKNLKVMVPFCRTVAEGEQVLGLMGKHGLKRGVGGLEVYVMCEIPSNVILAEEFAKIFDGFSIGSNDLTQLTLGVDRDSELVSHIYDENNDAVKRLISQVIATAKKKKRKIGICGQAPSDFPEFAKFLVREGIDSISLNPDTVVKTSVAINKMSGAST
ncbi:MAG: phosphoenolpyruvate synthase [Candidatus Komeilibacteria bacterium RIFCSPLOWO2_01_FULL_52_15]|uniref:Phosphoenolpyruvate synthase n=2 Tax=Candidatus Komeiliibacteriota TaxID=1817908 RepID=A0A1G2BQ17_9BACT|nr:MAG: phosphoenolpyruvate synthase [Candidatus Komeilibacteria bacterium RIFCSPHIGHO2_01_FULL_52_14]OGY91212.1 MAG: phosphoenolpyruvate synthase [Candidatus Komeilibacteria bacterium RIFCSPLOWO2_01_FULL_52_15]